MEIEKQRGISVASSVMQFDYREHVINLLDTRATRTSRRYHRVLTAVDSALMVIDAAKGVEEQTIKLLNVCRRNTPIVTFMNKYDREVRDRWNCWTKGGKRAENRCAPVTWPIGMGKTFRGVYHILQRRSLAVCRLEKPTNAVGSIEVIKASTTRA